MKLTRAFSKLARIGLVALLAGCAGAPKVDDNIAELELRDEALDVLFATEFPVESKDEALARAKKAVREGDIDKALFYYVRALQFQPDDVELLAHIGTVQMKRNNHLVASRAFQKALSHDPNHARSHECLGLIYMTEGNDSQAIHELTLAVQNDDNLWRAHDALGVYSDKAGDHASARLHYDKALSINPAAGHVMNNRGYSRFLAGDHPGAIDDLYTAANELNFSLAWANLARVYAKMRWYDNAIDAYKKVMSEADALNNTGQAAIQNGDLDEARRYLSDAIRLSPTYFPAAEENLTSLKDFRSLAIPQAVPDNDS